MMQVIVSFPSLRMQLDAWLLLGTLPSPRKFCCPCLRGLRLSITEQDSLRKRNVNVILELASSLIQGAEEDLINLIYNYIHHVFKEADVIAHCKAYRALSRILKEHSWFCSSRFVELKPPADVASLTNCFACFSVLIVHTLEAKIPGSILPLSRTSFHL
ncbi:ARM repeat superfamily protein [Euphorbia peplus]|nr:ARM repeat superfamily protein [Euphorbia peplus]